MTALDTPLAVLAGGGRLPDAVVRAVTAQGRPVHVFAIDGEADADLPADIHLLRGQINRLARETQRRGCRDLLMVGHVRERRLPRITECDLADLWTVARHWRVLRQGDDGLLRKVARILEMRGLTLVGVADVAPQLLMPAGVLGRIRPSHHDEDDIRIGAGAARDLGRRDIGQGVVVRLGRSLDHEGQAGTDAMLAGLAAAGNRGGLLVKCLKPQQDRRFDLPAIGPMTVRMAARAGLVGIAAEAGSAVLIDADLTRQLADELGLFVVGF